MLVDEPEAQVREVIGYMSGPADGLDIVQSWKSGGRTEFFGTVYMSQFCSVVRELGASGVIITYRPAPSSCDVIDEFSIYNIERKERRGLSYHVDNIGRLLKSYAILRRHGASSVVLTEGANYWFTALVLRVSKIRIIPSIHCTLWRPFQRERLPIRILHWLNRHLFFRWQRGPIMGVSQEIGRQVRKWAKQAPFYRFIPTYSESDFSRVPPPRPKSRFTILSAGRVEADKGMFDLIDAVTILNSRNIHVKVDICGEGTAVEPLRQVVLQRGLSAQVSVHGACARQELARLFGLCDAVIVPTRTEFEEGFAKTCAEAILAGRPVITSAVCPALDDVREAAVEVTPNDVVGYADAIGRLATDRAFYASKTAAAAALQAQFYDKSNSYGAVLRRILEEGRT
jgi:glycogen(starch) synthase